MTRIKFQGLVPYEPIDKLDDWGLTREQQETHVEQFRQLLEQHNLWRKEEHDYYTLLRFLRARNYEHDKAFKMWSDTIAWRRQFDVDAILDNFHFHEREQFLMAYPQGYHKTDKLGRPIYIQLLGKIDINTLKQITTEERMVKFHIQEYERCGKFIFPVCSRIAGHQIDQTFGIMDVKGVGLSHLTGEVKRLVSVLTKYDQDNYPEMLGRICIINAPMVFKAVWALIKPMLNPRTLNKIQICQSNYASDLLEWVEPENLPVWLGGRSKGTLLDDVGPWSDPEVLHRLEADLPAASRALRALRMSASSAPANAVGDDGDGYASPRSEASFVSVVSTVSSHAQGGDALGGPNLSQQLSVTSTDRADKADRAASSAERERPRLPGAPQTPRGAATPRGAHVHAAATAAAAAAAQQQQQQQHGQQAPLPVSASAAAAAAAAARALEGQIWEERASSEANAVAFARNSSLLDRVQALEALYAQQMQRLKGYMPAGAEARAAERRQRLAAPEGSLLARVDLLEEGLELLLRAQDLHWQEEERRRGASGCGGCTIC